MGFRSATLSLAALTALGACGGLVAPPDDPATVAGAGRTITCTVGPDCDAKWSRAVGWIAQNARWKIHTQTNDLILTYGPRDGDQDAAFSLTKIAQGGGVYAIEVTTSCGAPLGCNPSEASLRAALLTFIDPPH